MERAAYVSHMGRNARALMNLLHWAETGVESPMSPSPEHRLDGIEAGAQLPPAVAGADRLRVVLGTMPDGVWSHEVRTRSAGR
jgi:maleylpyruvate isomerase